MISSKWTYASAESELGKRQPLSSGAKHRRRGGIFPRVVCVSQRPLDAFGRVHMKLLLQVLSTTATYLL